ncbi:hypothetical protein [Salinibacillus aidingensis]|uniref:hypothetical protein n=1 Tax=Salinibacillus aidingensis TaxID=237684 RepID=UPI0031D3551B
MDRTTTEFVGDFTLKEILQLDAESILVEEFTGEKVLVYEISWILFVRKTGILIELKSPGYILEL